ncbi:MAG: DinB family protein [Gemmatimonadota bacterium]
MALVRWFDRRFDFTFPFELYPELIERLRGMPLRLMERVALFAPEEQRRRTSGWSVQEHAGHLADLDRILYHPRLSAYEHGDSTLLAADLTNATTEAANHNARTMEEVLTYVMRERNAFVLHLESLDHELFARSALHPRLNVPMRLVDLLLFVADHDDHHLAAITELARGRTPR